MAERKPKDPNGKWRWTWGPDWWHEIPVWVKVLSALFVVFTAGLAAAQLGVPGIVRDTAKRVDHLESWRERIEYIIPMVEADHMLIQEHKVQLDQVKVTLDGVWCVMRAETHGLDPLRECFVPRPTRNGDGGEQ